MPDAVVGAAAGLVLESPKREERDLEETPFLFFHSSMCFALACASFLAHSSEIFLPWFA